MSRRPFVAGNWKMHGSLEANAILLRAVGEATARLDGLDVAVCVPFPYLAQARELLAACRVMLGAQNVSEHERGAYTGEVAASMLAEFGCRHVIVGHSERRALYAERNEQIARKVVAALSRNVVPILCVGETLAERNSGRTEDVVLSQLDAVTEAAGPEQFSRLVVAYEPVWAIGTGQNATPEQAQSVHESIRRRLAASGVEADSLRVIYGGSVKPSNSRALFSMPDIDGGLIGGASLVAQDFVAICEAAAEVR